MISFLPICIICFFGFMYSLVFFRDDPPAVGQSDLFPLAGTWSVSLLCDGSHCMLFMEGLDLHFDNPTQNLASVEEKF